MKTLHISKKIIIANAHNVATEQKIADKMSQQQVIVNCNS
jgi:hypothetical protein